MSLMVLQTVFEGWKSTQRDQPGAAFRVKIETANDLFVFKEALKRAANVCDSISVLFTANPSDFVNSGATQH